MKKLYCVICGKYIKSTNTFKKTLVLSFVCHKCKNEDEKIFIEKEY